MSTTRSADAYGITHKQECLHPQRVARSVTGAWKCNGCGQESPTTTTTTTTEGTTNEDR